MARAILLGTAVVAVFAVGGAPPAGAQGGSGLYQPFPEPTRPESTREFYGDLLPASVTSDALRRGVVLPAGRSLATAGEGTRTASRRAGLAGHPGAGAGWIVGAVLAVAAGAGLLTVALRSRPPESS